MGGISGTMRAAACCAALLLGCGSPARPPAQSPRYPHSGDFAQQLAFGNATRTYVLHLPPDYARHVPLPLVVAFHGGGGDAAAFQRAAKLDAQADALGWAVVYPDGTGHWDRRLLTWNAGSCCGSAQEDRVDDVGFVLALLADLARDLDLDATRVYAVGHSNGGMMAYRLASAAPSHIAAVASVAGPDMTERGGSGPAVPVLHIHSVDDPRANYDGGQAKVLAFVSHYVEFRSVDETLSRWRDRDGCTGAGRVVEERKVELHSAELIDFGPCTGGSDVMLWRLHGAGHGWPGGKSQLPKKLVGPDTHVIRATDEIFHFLARFRRDDAAPLR